MNPGATLVIGTAGHIDHGKTRLVQALTGTNPDRLPEEQARGMTIDLGFASQEFEGCDFSFVDVPGHERFIRNMVAGATGIDVALLIVAADDSVMPQTREHAEVLSLLGVTRCVLVLTKMDLVDDPWADEVEAEARGLLHAVGITPLAAVRTSAETGRGLDDLRRVLLAAARDPQRPRAASTWFRLPVDRVFVIAGRGTVVTGSVAHGAVRPEDELELCPAGRKVRVRDVQVHNIERASVSGRLRLGVNLAGVALEDVQRGHELATPGHLQPTRCLDVWLASLRMPGKTRRPTLRLRFHTSTREVLAELRLVAPPGADVCTGVYGQLRTAEPIVATWGQHFILRDEAATRTLGGGRVVRLSARPRRLRDADFVLRLERLRTGTPAERVAELLHSHGWTGRPPALVAAEAGLPDADAAEKVCQTLVQTKQLIALETASQRVLVHSSYPSALAKDVGQRLQAYVDANPRAGGVSRSEWPAWMPRACAERFRPVVAERLIADGCVALVDNRVVPLGHRDALAPADQQLLDAMLREYQAGAWQPPDLDKLRCRTPQNEKRLRELRDLAVTRGQLVRVGTEVWLHQQRWDELVTRVVAALRERGKLTLSEIRTMLDSTRFYALPIAERLDALGITRRMGDQRMLGPKAPPTL